MEKVGSMRRSKVVIYRDSRRNGNRNAGLQSSAATEQGQMGCSVYSSWGCGGRICGVLCEVAQFCTEDCTLHAELWNKHFWLVYYYLLFYKFYIYNIEPMAFALLLYKYIYHNICVLLMQHSLEAKHSSCLPSTTRRHDGTTARWQVLAILDYFALLRKQNLMLYHTFRGEGFQSLLPYHLLYRCTYLTHCSLSSNYVHILQRRSTTHTSFSGERHHGPWCPQLFFFSFRISRSHIGLYNHGILLSYFISLQHNPKRVTNCAMYLPFLYVMYLVISRELACVGRDSRYLCGQ